MNKLIYCKEFEVRSPVHVGSQIILSTKSLVVRVPWSTSNFQCKMLNRFEQQLVLPQMRVPDNHAYSNIGRTWALYRVSMVPASQWGEKNLYINRALASAVSWLCLWYTIICQRNVTNPPTVVVVLCEINVLLVYFICFCPTDEQMLVLAYDRANLTCSFGLYTSCCVLLWDYCIWEITQILYSMHYVLDICTRYLVTNWLFKFY